MRISSEQSATIARLVKRVFGPQARVYLFGSRVDDARKGGDIDLYIHTGSTGSQLALKARLMAELQMALGEQHFDVIVARDPQRPIEREALKTGVAL